MLRQIEPITGLLPHEIPQGDLGARPELRWVSPTSLWVDETYQRDLGKRSYRLIRELILGFAWRKMKPPIVVEVGDVLHCVDGQHTAIAAATRKIPEIPVFVVRADSIAERADAFVGHNKDRIVMSSIDIYRAKLAAGDPDALDTDTVCKRAGIRIRQTNQYGKILVGDTASVGTVQRLVKRQGVRKARIILEGLVHGRRGPIGPAEIEALEALITLEAPGLTPEQIGTIVRAVGDRGVIEAKMQATSERRPQKVVLLEKYRAIMRKQMGVAA